MDKRLNALDETFDEIIRDLAKTLQAENLANCEFSIGQLLGNSVRSSTVTLFH